MKNVILILITIFSITSALTLNELYVVMDSIDYKITMNMRYAHPALIPDDFSVDSILAAFENMSIAEFTQADLASDSSGTMLNRRIDNLQMRALNLIYYRQ